MPKRKQPPMVDAPSGPAKHPEKRKALLKPEQELPQKRSLRSRGTVAAPEVTPSAIAEQSAALNGRTRRGKAVPAEQPEPELAVENAPAATRSRATRSRATKTDVEPAESMDVDKATEQPAQPTKSKQTRKKKAPVPPSERVTRSRSNSVASVESQEPEIAPVAERLVIEVVIESPAKPATRKMATTRGKRKAKETTTQEPEQTAEAATEPAAVEYSGPRSRTRSKTKPADDKENEEPVPEAPKRATRSKKAAEPAIEIQIDQPRVKRQRVQGTQEIVQAPKKRQGRSAKNIQDEPAEPEQQQPVTPATVLAIPTAQTMPGQQDEVNAPSQQLFQEQGLYAGEDIAQNAAESEKTAEAEDTAPVDPEIVDDAAKLVENSEEQTPNLSISQSPEVTQIDVATPEKNLAPIPSEPQDSVDEDATMADEEAVETTMKEEEEEATNVEEMMEGTKEEVATTSQELIGEAKEDVVAEDQKMDDTAEDEEDAMNAVQETQNAIDTSLSPKIQEPDVVIEEHVTTTAQEVDPSVEEGHIATATEQTTQSHHEEEAVIATQELGVITEENSIEPTHEISPIIGSEIVSGQEIESATEEGVAHALQEQDIDTKESVDSEAKEFVEEPTIEEVESKEEEAVAMDDLNGVAEHEEQPTDVEDEVATDEEAEAADEYTCTNALRANTVAEEVSVVNEQGVTATTESVITHTEKESEGLEENTYGMELELDDAVRECVSNPGSGLSGVFEEVSLHDEEISEQRLPDACAVEEDPTVIASDPETINVVEGEFSMLFAEASEQGVPVARVVDGGSVITSESNVSMHYAETSERGVLIAREGDDELTLDESEVQALYARMEARMAAERSERGVLIAHEGDEDLTLDESELAGIYARMEARAAESGERGVHIAHEEGAVLGECHEQGMQNAHVASEESGQGVQFGHTVEEELVTCEQGVHYAHDDVEEVLAVEQGVQNVRADVTEETVAAHSEQGVQMAQVDGDESVREAGDVDMMDVDAEFLVEEERGDTPEKGDVADGGWTDSANPSALAPLSQAAINAGAAQDAAGPEEAGSSASPIAPQTPTRSSWGQWGHLRHQPRLSSPLKSYCITAQYSPPREETPARGRRISENGIISRSGDPSPLRSEELSGRDFNTPVGSPSQASPRMRATPGPRRRGRSRSVRGSSPLKNAVDFAALDAGDEGEGGSRPSSRMASPLARLASDYDPNQDISELREEEVLLTPGAEQPLGNILDEAVEEQLPEGESAGLLASSDVGYDDVGVAASSLGLSQGFDGADSPQEKPKRRSRLPVPKPVVNTASPPFSARLKRVSQTKNLSDRELSKVTARNTTRNGVYKNAKFERKVVRITRKRPPSPNRDTQTAAAEEARQLRQQVFEETGVALGPGDDSDYVPPQVSPSAKKVKWHEHLEHELDENEKARFYTERGILAPERVRRDSSTVHEITIQKILYDGERDILDEDFDDGF